MSNELLPCRKCGSAQISGPNYSVQWQADISCLICGHAERYIRGKSSPETPEELEVWRKSIEEFSKITAIAAVTKEWNRRAKD